MALCPDADRLAAMDDAEFWDHIAESIHHRDGTAAYDPYDDSHQALDADLADRNGGPCPECGAHGACAWDAEGLPLIHATTGDTDR